MNQQTSEASISGVTLTGALAGAAPYPTASGPSALDMMQKEQHPEAENYSH
jgi:hypothetical protein